MNNDIHQKKKWFILTILLGINKMTSNLSLSIPVYMAIRVMGHTERNPLVPMLKYAVYFYIFTHLEIKKNLSDKM